MNFKDMYEEQYEEVSKVFEKIRKHIQKKLEKKYGNLTEYKGKVDTKEVYAIVIEKVNKLYPKENQKLKDFLSFFYMEYFFRRTTNHIEEEEELEEEPEYLN